MLTVVLHQRACNTFRTTALVYYSPYFCMKCSNLEYNPECSTSLFRGQTFAKYVQRTFLHLLCKGIFA